jgi:hypothetical protein
MGKSYFNDEFLVLLGPKISRFLHVQMWKKNKPKQQRVHALVLSLWFIHVSLFWLSLMFGSKAGAYLSEAPFVKIQNMEIPEPLKGQEYSGISLSALCFTILLVKY